MTNFTYYAKHIHKPTRYPEVLFGIAKGPAELLESTNLPYYFGSPEKSPEALGMRRIEVGIFTHPDRPGRIYTFHGDTMKEHVNINAAHDEVFKHRQLHQDEIENQALDLMQQYHHTKYSPFHKTAIAQYTDAWSPYNKKIIRKEDLSDDMVRIIGHLDTAMNVTKLHEPLTVYSGTDPAHANLLRNNPIVHHPSFLSSSLSMSKARGFADQGSDGQGDVVAIHLPKGFSGVYTGDMSSIPSEKEFILPRHTNLIIDPHKKDVVYSMDGNRKFIVHHAYPKV